jgi:hypothetical protein
MAAAGILTITKDTATKTQQQSLWNDLAGTKAALLRIINMMAGSNKEVSSCRSKICATHGISQAHGFDGIYYDCKIGF